MSALSDRRRAAEAERSDPNRRMWLLEWTRPDIHIAVGEVLALPVERPIARGHSLQDQVMRLPQAVHHAARIRVGRGDFVRYTLDETHLQTTGRDDVNHRHLFRDTEWIQAIGKRHAECQKSCAFGDPRENAEHD